MEIGIIGLPKSGKTTIFNALTGARAQTSAFSTGSEQSNLAVVKVPDERLVRLESMFKPKRVVPAEVRYVDFPGTPKGLGRSEGIAGRFLLQLSQMDALLHVVRAFENPALPHPEGSVDPFRDVATLDLELVFSDIAVIERRLQRLGASLKGAKPQERELAMKEASLLERIKESLEREVPLREQTFNQEESRILSGFQFLTAKPMLLLFNIGEQQVDEVEKLEKSIEERCGKGVRLGLALCGKLEEELAQLSPEEAQEFRSSLGLKEAAMDRMIRLSYQALGLVSFFTVGDDEVRAWTVTHNTVAPRAAGKVHSDMERGFIRAEVVAYDDLMRCGGMADARRQGLLRLEGKTYHVQDGDVITFLFNA